MYYDDDDDDDYYGWGSRGYSERDISDVDDSPNNPDGSPKIKLGRCCFTCHYTKSRTGHFALCSKNKQRVWDRAYCPKWKLTKSLKRLCQFERFMDGRRLTLQPEKRAYYYKKQNNVKVNDEVTIKLGRCCFTCARRGVREGHFIQCGEHNRKIWDKAQCRKWVLTKDVQQLSQFKKYLRKAKLGDEYRVNP